MAKDVPRRDKKDGYPSRLLGYDDLSRLTGRSVVALQRDVRSGTGPRVTRLGRQVRFLPEDVHAWFQRCAGLNPR
jgi:predicted DNA-binding transcriptional regulator AlpA